MDIRNALKVILLLELLVGVMGVEVAIACDQSNLTKEDIEVWENHMMWAYPHRYTLARLSRHCQEQGQLLPYVEGPNPDQLFEFISRKREPLHLSICERMQEAQALESEKNSRAREPSSQKKQSKRKMADEKPDASGRKADPGENRSKKNRRTSKTDGEQSQCDSCGEAAKALAKDYENYEITPDSKYKKRLQSSFEELLVPLLKVLMENYDQPICASATALAIVASEENRKSDRFSLPASASANYVLPAFQFLVDKKYLKKKLKDMRSAVYFVTPKLRELLGIKDG